MPLTEKDDVFGCAACAHFAVCSRKENAKAYAEAVWEHLEPAFDTLFADIFGKHLGRTVSEEEVDRIIDGFFVSRTFTCEHKLTADGLKTEKE